MIDDEDYSLDWKEWCQELWSILNGRCDKDLIPSKRSLRELKLKIELGVKRCMLKFGQ